MKKIFILAVIATIVVTAVSNKPFTGEEDSILNLLSGLLVVVSAFGLIYNRKVGVLILIIASLLQILVFGMTAFWAMTVSIIVLLLAANKETEKKIQNFVNRVLN
ncbi:MAG: hypothetical protein ILA52_01060 [Alphaproteobacteria bacterium]|nr:hypothetical protein [Alphaproteobacteria bacterium]